MPFIPEHEFVRAVEEWAHAIVNNRPMLARVASDKMQIFAQLRAADPTFQAEFMRIAKIGTQQDPCVDPQRLVPLMITFFDTIANGALHANDRSGKEHFNR